MNISRKSAISLTAFMMTLGSLPLINGQAHADLVFNVNNIVGTTYTYDLNFADNIDAGSGLASQRLQAGNFATIYDVGGFTGATLDPAFASLFTLSTQTVGITPGGTLPSDDPTLTNVTLTYNGPTLTSDQSYMNILHLTSTFPTLNTNGQYSSLVTKNAGDASGTDIGSIGTVSVPGPLTGPRVPGTPEPGSVALFVGAGLSGSLFAFRRRRRRN
ncbi:MAG: hypothetical protein JWL77_3575 [Chthonomonadaceae bacterium]|nr:hypothetical protein [Chthonomonadaceae bacterium]